MFEKEPELGLAYPEEVSEAMLNLNLVDEKGQPLGERIRIAITGLEPGFRCKFPSIRDEAVIANLFEDAARRVAAHEERSGPIESLPAFARKVLENAAYSHLRAPDHQVNGHAANGARHFEHLISPVETAEQIETMLDTWSTLQKTSGPRTVRIMARRWAGFKSSEIAAVEGLTPGNVDKIISRARAELLRFRGKWKW